MNPKRPNIWITASRVLAQFLEKMEEGKEQTVLKYPLVLISHGKEKSKLWCHESYFRSKKPDTSFVRPKYKFHELISTKPLILNEYGKKACLSYSQFPNAALKSWKYANWSGGKSILLRRFPLWVGAKMYLILCAEYRNNNNRRSYEI